MEEYETSSRISWYDDSTRTYNKPIYIYVGTTTRLGRTWNLFLSWSIRRPNKGEYEASSQICWKDVPTRTYTGADWIYGGGTHRWGGVTQGRGKVIDMYSICTSPLQYKATDIWSENIQWYHLLVITLVEL